MQEWFFVKWEWIFQKTSKRNNLQLCKVKTILIIEDENVKWKKMDVYIKKFQDPKEVDKL